MNNQYTINIDKDIYLLRVNFLNNFKKETVENEDNIFSWKAVINNSNLFMLGSRYHELHLVIFQTNYLLLQLVES